MGSLDFQSLGVWKSFRTEVVGLWAGIPSLRAQWPGVSGWCLTSGRAGFHECTEGTEPGCRVTGNRGLTRKIATREDNEEEGDGGTKQ